MAGHLLHVDIAWPVLANLSILAVLIIYRHLPPFFVVRRTTISTLNHALTALLLRPFLHRCNAILAFFLRQPRSRRRRRFILFPLLLPCQGLHLPGFLLAPQPLLQQHVLDESLNLGTEEVALDARGPPRRLGRDQVDAHDEAARLGALEGDLGPGPGRVAQVDDNGVLFEDAVLFVHLLVAGAKRPGVVSRSG